MTTAVYRWRRMATSVCLVAAAILGGASPVAAQDLAGEVRGARFPALNADGSRLAFSYQGDIWICAAAGGAASRITVHAAYDAYPRWSPDGRWVAFSSNREGGFDIFVVRAEGGQPTRLTSHPADDFVCNWSSDGKAILFSSARTSPEPQVFELTVSTRALRQLTDDPSGARYAARTLDGSALFYTRGSQPWWRCRYSGPGNADIARVGAKNGVGAVLTTCDGFDGWPMPGADGRLFYVSAPSGVPNLWSLDADGRHPRQLTSYTRGGLWFPSASGDGSKVVYERDGQLFLVSTRGPSPGEPTKLAIRAPSDRRTDAVTWLARSSGFSDLALASDGKSLAFAMAGRIWIGKVDGGDGQIVTPAASWARKPCWSPDAKRIAYVDRRERWAALFVVDIAAKTEVELPVEAELDQPTFSPDGRRIAALSPYGPKPGLWVLGAEPAAKDAPSTPALVAAGRGIESYSWSPDGRWLAFARRDRLGLCDIWVCPSTGGPAVNLTRGAGDLRAPRWSRDGRALLCIGTWGVISGKPESGVFVVELSTGPVRGEASGGAGTTGSGGTLPSDEDGEPGAQRRRPVGAGRPASPAAQLPGAPPPTWPFGPPVQAAQRVAIDLDGITDRVRLVAGMPSAPVSADWAPDGRTIIVLTGAGDRVAIMATDSLTRATRPLADAGGADVAPLVAGDGLTVIWLAGDGMPRVLRSGAAAPVPVLIPCRYESDARLVARASMREALADIEGSSQFQLSRREIWRNEASLLEGMAVNSEAAEDMRDALLAALGDAGVDGFVLSVDARTRPSASGTLGLDFDLTYGGPGLRIARSLRNGPAYDAPQGVGDGEILHSIDGAVPSSVDEAFSLLQDRIGRAVELVVGPTPPATSTEPAPGVRTLRVTPIAFDVEQQLRRAEAARAAERRVADLAGATIVYCGLAGPGEASGRGLARAVVDAMRDGRALIIDLRQSGHDEPLDALVAACREARERAMRSGRSADESRIAILVGERTSAESVLAATSLRRDFGATVVGTPVWVAATSTRSRVLPNGMVLRLPGALDELIARAGVRLDPNVLVPSLPASGQGDAALDAAVGALLASARP